MKYPALKFSRQNPSPLDNSKHMQRISVTTLEKFRRYMQEVSSFDTEQSLVESLKGLFKGNDKTEFGSAYHKLIEGKYQIHQGGIVLVEDKDKSFAFNAEQASPALEYRKNHPVMVHEMDARKVYETVFGPIQVTSRVDGVDGSIVRDIKTRFKPLYKESEYSDSVQWQFYLDIMEADSFCYDVFEIKGFDSLPKQKPYIMPDVQIIALPEIKCERFTGMEDNIQMWLNCFMEYIDNRNFFHLLKPAIEPSELNF